MSRFNKKCNKILLYLKERQGSAEKITWEKFTSETKITKRDPVMYYLKVDAGFIDTSNDMVRITNKGIEFVEHVAMAGKPGKDLAIGVVSWIAMIIAGLVLIFGFVSRKL